MLIRDYWQFRLHAHIAEGDRDVERLLGLGRQLGRHSRWLTPNVAREPPSI